MNEYAVIFTQRETAQLLPIEVDTDAIGAHEVAGHTTATLISAGTELNSGYLGDKFPKPSGYAAAFKVEKVGANVEGIAPGDHAFCMGNHASYQRKPAAQVLRLPEGLAPETAVFARMMSVSMTTLTTTTARPPGKVLITGLGLVGHLAAKNFQACGYEVHACDPVPSRRQIASETGIRNVLPAVPLDDPDLAGQFQLAIECSGHEQALLDAAGAVRKRAEVVCIATPWQQYTQLPLHDLHRLIFFNYVVIRSGWEWELPRQPEDFRTNSIFENLAGALKWLAEGRVDVDGIYTQYDPETCQRAYRDLLDKKNPRLAVVFDWAT